MNKRILTAGLILFTGLGSQAMAVCSGSNRLGGAAIQALLTNQYACGTNGTEKWDELHTQTGYVAGSPQTWSGKVTDYKLGPGNPVDPPTDVGTYSITDSFGGSISYTYGTTTYTYNVYGAASPYTFCNTQTSQTLSITVQANHCY